MEAFQPWAGSCPFPLCLLCSISLLSCTLILSSMTSAHYCYMRKNMWMCVYVKLIEALLHPLNVCMCIYMERGWGLLKPASSTMYARAYLISLALFGSPRELLASPRESSFVSSEKSIERSITNSTPHLSLPWMSKQT